MPHDTVLRSEQEFRQLIENVRDYAIITLDPDGRIISWNAGAQRLKGYEEAEIIGESMQRLYPPEAIAAGTPARLLAQATAAGRCEDEGWRVRKDGTRFFANVVITAMRSPEGQLRGFAKITRDITDRRKTQEALRESEAQLKRAEHLAKIGSAWWDIRSGRIEWSDETYRIYGVERDAFVPAFDNVLRLVHPDDHIQLRADRELTLTGRSPRPSEYRILRSDGTTRRLYREFSAVADDSGATAAFIISVQDVTERRQTEEQLQQAQKMEAIGNLTGGMAHDFNNLLGIIIANLDLLREIKGDDEDVAEFSQEALDAALRGAELTRRLLAFARQQPLQPRQVDVNELVQGITRLLTRTLGANVDIGLQLSPDAWPTVVDPAQLEASLVNLANNARDAMPSGGRLTVRTGNRYLDADYASVYSEVAPGPYVMIEVSDTGTGMPPDVRTRIFEPFFTTKSPGRGTGLGLSMVFGFMKQSHGHINVYSEPGMGTTFRLYLPQLADGAEAADESGSEQAVAGGSEAILIVEDNVPLRRVAVRQLSGMGYRVLEADNATAALPVMEQESIDLLLTDIVMPGGWDGVRLAEEIRRRWPSVKIVFTSGFAAPQANGVAWDLPENARLLTKPYRRTELAEIIRRTLDE